MKLRIDFEFNDGTKKTLYTLWPRTRGLNGISVNGNKTSCSRKYGNDWEWAYALEEHNDQLRRLPVGWTIESKILRDGNDTPSGGKLRATRIK